MLKIFIAHFRFDVSVMLNKIMSNLFHTSILVRYQEYQEYQNRFI